MRILIVKFSLSLSVIPVQIFGDDSNKQSLIQKEIKRRFNSGNACYHSVQNLVFSCLPLSKNVKLEYIRR
jgi:hypothetical protein